jgi:hypothetical protein
LREGEIKVTRWCYSANTFMGVKQSGYMRERDLIVCAVQYMTGGEYARVGGRRAAHLACGTNREGDPRGGIL